MRGSFVPAPAFRLMLVLAMALALIAGPRLALAQSADLDHLFAELRDPAAVARAQQTEARIWNLWMHGGTAAENEELARATQAMNGADPSGAERRLNDLIGSTQGFAEAYNKRATLYFLMGRYDESLADIERTLDLEPRHFGALSGRGMILQRLGRDAEAIAAYKDALTINPNMEGARAALELLERQTPDL